MSFREGIASFTVTGGMCPSRDRDTKASNAKGMPMQLGEGGSGDVYHAVIIQSNDGFAHTDKNAAVKKACSSGATAKHSMTPCASTAWNMPTQNLH